MASTKHNVVTAIKYVGTLVLGGALAGATIMLANLSDGTEVIKIDRQVIFPGSAINIVGTLTEDDRVGNGTQTGWVLQNTSSKALLVKGVNLYVTTAGETTVVDISRGTGSIAAGVNAASGTTLGDNITLSAKLHTLSGTLLEPTTSKNFIFDEYGGTNDHIIIASTSSEAGSGTVIQYHIEAYQFE
jgi:hypothetical protein